LVENSLAGIRSRIAVGNILSNLGAGACSVHRSQSNLRLGSADHDLVVVVCGAVTGSILPMLFSRLGLEPAITSNPFVAGMNDIIGIVVYVSIARIILGGP